MAPNRFALLAAGGAFTITHQWMEGAARCETQDQLLVDRDLALNSVLTRFHKSTITGGQVQLLLAPLGVVRGHALRLLPPAISGDGIAVGLRAAADLVGMWWAPLECRATSLLTAEAMAAVREFLEKLSALNHPASGAASARRLICRPTMRMHPAKECRIISFPTRYQELVR